MVSPIGRQFNEPLVDPAATAAGILLPCLQQTVGKGPSHGRRIDSEQGGGGDGRSRGIGRHIAAALHEAGAYVAITGRDADTLDAAADAEDQAFRTVFERALGDRDPWMRWKAVRALGDLGPGPSRAALEVLADDPEFRVRFEVSRVLRSVG